MIGLQSSNIIREDPLRINIKDRVYTDYHYRCQTLNTKVNLWYHVTLNKKVKVTSKGHNSVEVIKVYKPTKCQVWSWYHLKELSILNTKINLKYHVTLSIKSRSRSQVKVTIQ